MPQAPFQFRLGFIRRIGDAYQYLPGPDLRIRNSAFEIWQPRSNKQNHERGDHGSEHSALVDDDAVGPPGGERHAAGENRIGFL